MRIEELSDKPGTAKPETEMWGIALVYCANGSKDQVVLGGAAWDSKKQRDEEFAKIPVFEGVIEDCWVIADTIDDNLDIIDDKAISVRTAEILLGKPLEELIAAAHARNAQALKEIAHLINAS